MAKFYLRDIFYFDSVKSIFLIGDIIDGTISIGMKIQVRGGSMRINSIESVDGELENKPVSKIALKISSDRSVYSKLRNEEIIGTVLDISH